MVALSTAIAPVLGGTLLAALPWQWLFAVNIPFGLASVVLALRALPGERVASRKPFDVAGAVLSALAMGALIMAADAVSSWFDAKDRGSMGK